jgi:hypothetical protein
MFLCDNRQLRTVLPGNGQACLHGKLGKRVQPVGQSRDEGPSDAQGLFGKKDWSCEAR